MVNAGCWMLGAGCCVNWRLDVGHWGQDAGYGVRLLTQVATYRFVSTKLYVFAQHRRVPACRHRQGGIFVTKIIRIKLKLRS